MPFTLKGIWTEQIIACFGMLVSSSSWNMLILLDYVIDKALLLSFAQSVMLVLLSLLGAVE
jgi:hypothetical protein